MNIFTRIFTTVSAKVDQAVSQVENHDAIVEAALGNTRAAAAKARVRLARVQKDGKGLRQKLEQLEKLEQSWAHRAKQAGRENEQQALECVSRRNTFRDQAIQTRSALQQHAELEKNIRHSVAHIEQRLQELTQQRNLLRSRHSAADAMRIISRLENEPNTHVDDILERWEMSIAETEYFSGSVSQSDPLDDVLTAQENEQTLRAELDELLNADNKEASHE